MIEIRHYMAVEQLKTYLHRTTLFHVDWEPASTTWSSAAQIYPEE